jgi:tRNA U34 5-methylaminomethyl-2-thiouridine-forming methyltransferase MnmC
VKKENLIIKKTSDGSTTIYNIDLDETYHSIHGALQEAIHVFIKNGLENFLTNSKNGKPTNILEIGFGTGLNCLLSLDYSKKKAFKINYTGIEPHPLSGDLIEKLDYGFDNNNKIIFNQLHKSKWNEFTELITDFNLKKLNCKFQDFNDNELYDVVYFDAFGPRVEEYLWDINIFRKIYKMISLNGLLVTYCAKGQVRRDLEKVGFIVERLPGPPGKREMLRAKKYIK